MNNQIIFDGMEFNKFENDSPAYRNKRIIRNWENAFQRWCNKNAEDERTSTGICGFGAMCDWCSDNSYGRPCVRALNAMCKEKRTQINYSKRNFDDVWNGKQ